MKLKRLLGLTLCGSLALSAAMATDLVILHTNDTHSLIDPDKNGEGGVLQRKAIIDSVRNAEKNVLLVDAGDVVQGTLYFKFFKGDVEYPLMNMAGYDVQILGNHEFDNGLEELAEHYKTLKASRLSANYDVSATPLAGMLDPYVIKKVGGKKIGFIGINLDPTSIIAANNYEGLKFNDIIETANRTAAMLKREKHCDMVVVVSHIGAVKENDKTTDYELARASHDIDIIIGGHSHTLIKPDGSTPDCPPLVENADGRPVVIAQTGKYGKYLGYLKINLDNLKSSTPADYEHRLIHVTDRFPASVLDKKMAEFIRPFADSLRSVQNNVIARSGEFMESSDRVGRYVNWTADFAVKYGKHKADSLRAAGVELPEVDFGMMNVGGIRHDMQEGDITEGQILSTFPFNNHMVLVKIKGKDFIDAMRVAAAKGGESVSNEIRVVMDDEGVMKRVVLNGEEMDPQKDYVFSTIDYLAWGNDDFVTLANGEIIWRDEVEMSAPMLAYVKNYARLGIPVTADPRPRFVVEQPINR